MRSIVAIVVAILSGASAQDLRHNSSDVGATIDRGLAFLAKDALAWKNEHNCVSCHHAGLVIWSMREARQRGHKVDEAVLALLNLTRCDSKYGAAAWKGHDWGVLRRLHEKGYVGDPVGKSKSVALTAEGVAKSEELFGKLFGSPK